MFQPPVSDLSPWLPNHWITQTGYALNERDLIVGLRDNPIDRMDKQSAVFEVDLIMEKVMCK